MVATFLVNVCECECIYTHVQHCPNPERRVPAIQRCIIVPGPCGHTSDRRAIRYTERPSNMQFPRHTR